MRELIDRDDAIEAVRRIADSTLFVGTDEEIEFDRAVLARELIAALRSLPAADKGEGMGDIGKKLLEGMKEFTQKLERGDLIEATRLRVCPTCEGIHPEFCSGCGGYGVVGGPTYLNDWDHPEGGGAADCER